MKNRTIYILSFFIPVIIFLIASTLNGRLPFFSGVYQVIDANTQYPGFFIEFINLIKSGNIFYSLNGGLGLNFLGVITYYLLSPFNLLLFFFDAKILSYFYFITIYTRIGLAGLTMAIYLSKQKKKDATWIVTLSSIFALIGFMSTYYYNVMWIDSVIMLPLILLGIDKLFENGKPYFYIITLTLGILFNYYIGYMLCVFSVIYFIYKLFAEENYKINKEIFIKFFWSSLLVGALSCIVIIPTYYALMSGKVDMFTFNWGEESSTIYNAFEFFYQLLPGTYKSEDWEYGPPAIYTTLFVYVLVIFFFFNKEIKLKEKIVAGLILLFYYLSFAIEKLNLAWHLFQKPVGFQHRYTFTFSIFLLILAYKSLLSFPKLKLNNKIKGLIFLILTIVTITSFIYVVHINPEPMLKSTYFFLLLSFLTIIVYLFIFEGKTIFIFFFIFLEIFINIYNCLNHTKLEYNYPDIYQKISENEKAVNYIKNKDDSFYRMEKITSSSSNDGMLYNYHGLNIFCSIYNINLNEFMDKHMGIKTAYGKVNLDKINPVFLSLFNFKYLIGKTDYYHLIKENNLTSIYENKYPLSLGIMIPNDYLSITLNENKFSNLEKIYSAFAGTDATLFKEKQHTNLIKLENLHPNPSYILTDNKSGILYNRINEQEPGYAYYEYQISEDTLFMDFNDYENLYKIFINDEQYDFNNNYLITLKASDKITIVYQIDDESNLIDENYALFDYQEYEEMSEIINSNLLTVKPDSKHLLEGTVAATTEKTTLFLSLPYEENFSIKVDGQEVDYFAIFDTFIGIELTKGKHQITIDYLPKGLILGSSVTLTGVVILIIYYYVNRKKSN